MLSMSSCISITFVSFFPKNFQFFCQGRSQRFEGKLLYIGKACATKSAVK